MAESVVLAFDLGGTDLKAARVTRGGDVRGFRRSPSRAREGEGPLFAAIAEAAERLGGAMGPAIAGFGCPGVVHPETGALVHHTPNLQLAPDFPLRERLEGVLRSRVAVDNDANLAALAEHTLGAAKGARVSLTVTVGTGIGCGIVADGRLLRGSFGGAGELGHLPLGSDGPPCACGVAGCAEPLAGGAGLLARAQEAGLAVNSAREVFDSGHPRAPWIRERMTERLAQMLGAAVNLLNPDVVVIGGGIAQAGEKLFTPVKKALDRYALESHRRRLRVVPAKLGEQAGVIGAGLLAWEQSAARRG